MTHFCGCSLRQMLFLPIVYLFYLAFVRDLSAQNPTAPVVWDTIRVLNVDTLVVRDTITTYFKVNLPVCFSSIRNNSKQNSSVFNGFDTGLDLNYVRNKIYVGVGLHWSRLNGSLYTDSIYNHFLSLRDTTFNLLQEVDGEIIITPVNTTYEFHDSTLQVVETLNNYSIVQIPIIFGFIFDKGSWSFLNGGGINLQFYSSLPKNNLVRKGEERVVETDFIRPFNIGFQIQSQTLYYLTDQLSVGVHLNALYNPVSVYKVSFGDTMRRIKYDLGIQVSYIL